MVPPPLPAILALVTTGLGHLYLGRPRRAAIVVLLQLAALLPLLLFAFGRLSGPTSLVVALLLPFLVLVGVCRDAARLAPVRQKLHPRPRVRHLVYVGWILLVLVLSQLGIADLRAHHRQAFRVPTMSMAPTLLAGDYFFADKAVYRDAGPERGDVIVHRFPDDPSQSYIKRVVGLPGERIERLEGCIAVDGAVDRSLPSLRPFPPVELGEDEWFVVGDNLAHSSDSRAWGPIGRQHLVGRVQTIYWSWDATTGSARWGRVGRRVR